MCKISSNKNFSKENVTANKHFLNKDTEKAELSSAELRKAQ